jgi:hypothetical protein
VNKSTTLGVLALIPATLLFLSVGCTNKTKERDKDDDEVVVKKGGGKRPPAKKLPELEAPTDGVITGFVKIKGKAPEMKPIDALKGHGDAKTCLMGEAVDQTWHVDDGRVADVVIFLGKPEGKRFSDKVKDKSAKTFVLDQPFCQYVPHVVGFWPDVQKLVAKNDAAVNHNVKVVAGGDVGTFDKTLSPKQETEINLKGITNEKLVSASCSIHTWMSGKIVVFDHPYFGVTDKKGEFKIENVPTGVELSVFIWHESMGDLSKKDLHKKMTFKAGDNSLGELNVTGK